MATQEQDPPSPKEARALLKEARTLAKKAAKRMSDEARADVDSAIARLESALADDPADLVPAYGLLDEVTEKRLASFRKSKAREYAESIGIAVLFALSLRGFVIEPFQIPSPSMEPTLLVGDKLFVAKYTYGLRVPFTTHYLARWKAVERGDIIVFEFPLEEVQTQVNLGVLTRRLDQYSEQHGGYPSGLEDLTDPRTGQPLAPTVRADGWSRPFAYELAGEGYSLTSSGQDGDFGTVDDYDAETSAFASGLSRNDGRDSCVDEASLRHAKDYIKRVIGLPGDRIEVRDNRVYVNGVLIEQDDVTPISPSGVLREANEEMDNGLDYRVRLNGSGRPYSGTVVREGHVFVMGDNRDASSDGRCWGQVPMENIKGKALFVFFSRSVRTGDVRWERVGHSVYADPEPLVEE